MDWFLYDNSLRHERVNVVHIFLSKCGELVTIPKGGSRTAATSKMQRFVIIVNGFHLFILELITFQQSIIM